MSDLRPHEVASPFFRLSPEIRLAIYNCLVPRERIYIDLCSFKTPTGNSLIGKRRSIMSNLALQTLNINSLTRGNGLHLLLVSRRTKEEVLSLLGGTTVRFHCHKCFEELLANISLGLGVGSNWMKHIEIVLDLSTQMTRRHYLTLEVGRMMARETMETARKTGWMYWGRRDLHGRERWRYEVMKEDGCQSPDQGPTLPLPGNNVGQITQLLPTPTGFPFPNGPQHIGAMVQQQAALTSAPVRWLISAWFDEEGS